MKHMPLFFVFTLILFVVGCQETTKKTVNNNNNSNNNTTNCYINNNYNTVPGCPGYCQANPSSTYCTIGGSTAGGSTGGSTTCTNPTLNDKTCANYCTTYPYPRGTGCLANGTNCNIYPTAAGCNGTSTNNPYRFYYSGYVDKNWMVNYPYVPAISCAAATAPSGISYTPYDTRKGSITLRGQINYDPASGQEFFDTTSELLRTKSGAQNFFWGDSILKVRFIANVQPESRNTSTVCPGRVTGKSTMKGYGRIKFDLTLVGTTLSGTTQTVSLGTQIIDVNKCTSAMDLSGYAAQFPGGIYFKISNVWGNQEWSPSAYTNEPYIYDTYGFIYPQNPYVAGTWKQIRTSDCWSLDIEVASNGTKTFN